MECAASEGRSSGGGGSGGGLERDEKLRLCLKVIRRLVAGAGAGAAGAIPIAATLEGGSLEIDASSASAGRSFAEAALDFACGVVEREWLGKRREVDEAESQNGGGDAEEVRKCRTLKMCIPAGTGVEVGQASLFGGARDCRGHILLSWGGTNRLTFSACFPSFAVHHHPRGGPRHPRGHLEVARHARSRPSGRRGVAGGGEALGKASLGGRLSGQEDGRGGGGVYGPRGR